MVRTDDGPRNGDAAMPQRPPGTADGAKHDDFLMRRYAAMLDRPLCLRNWIVADDKGGYAMNGEPKGGAFKCIVLGFAYFRFWKSGGHSECYAIANEQLGGVPADQCPKPQSGNCKDCPHSRQGTGANGQGYSCKVHRRFVLGRINNARSDDLFLFSDSFAATLHWSKHCKFMETYHASSPLHHWTRVERKTTTEGHRIHTFEAQDRLTEKELDWVSAKAEAADEILHDASARYSR